MLPVIPATHDPVCIPIRSRRCSPGMCGIGRSAIHFMKATVIAPETIFREESFLLGRVRILGRF